MVETDIILSFLVGNTTGAVITGYYLRYKFKDSAKSMAEDEEFQEFMDETIGNVMENMNPEGDSDEEKS